MTLDLDLQLFAEDRTEEATPHRLQEVRRKGQAARSNDLSAAVVLLSAMLFLYFWRERFYQEAATLLVRAFREGWREPLDVVTLPALLAGLSGEAFFSLLPFFGLAAVFGLAANYAQVGFLFSLEPIRPRLENLNPMQGLQRLFSRRSLVDLGKSLAKVVLVGMVVFQVVRGRLNDLFFILDMSLPQALAVVEKLLFQVGLAAMAVFLGVAVVDYVFQRREFQRNLRMTKQEVKEELKQTEGDPLVRSRLREKQRQLARHRMMRAVPEATVVVTNPTHIAVALRYREQEDGAPRVVAKGAGSVAARIVQIARENDVPIVQNPPVAQALFRQVEIGQEIPVELYQAVAQILAFVYRLQGKRNLA
ncbi:MAG: flagellar biosynthesis protein FlhB [Clostridia bacterium]|nr:flagellar biosynthesis protein FlhB [Clostridia bacterium]